MEITQDFMKKRQTILPLWKFTRLWNSDSITTGCYSICDQDKIGSGTATANL